MGGRLQPALVIFNIYVGFVLITAASHGDSAL